MKKPLLFVAALIGTAILFQFCSGTKKTKTAAAPAMPANAYTFEKNVLPLINTKCAPCHIAPDGKKKHYVTYDVVKADVDSMIRRVQLNPNEKGFMPFKKTEKLPDSLIQVFVKWKANGLLEK